MNQSVILVLDNVSVAYNDFIALENASFKVNKSDFIGVIGPNGGGKSTLLKCILGLLPLRTGSVSFYREGDEVSALRIGYLPQYNTIDRRFPISVREIMHSGIRSDDRMSKVLQKEAVEQMALKMGLEAKMNKPIEGLSGGELQRTFLGRALISQPELLILDEPASYLDMEFENRLPELLLEANREQSILMVSHNIPAVQTMAKSLVCVNKKLHYHPTTQVSQQCLFDTFFKV